MGAGLRDGPLPVGECVSVLRDVARALAYAHEHGVVHPDVKPDNVMLSGGAAVVTDFGIAKAIAAAAGGPPARDGADLPATAITQLGVGLGTPAYMAPEQALGDPDTNHCADIDAFGCLAYELFAGKPPFHGLPTHQIIAAHVGTVPVPLSEVSTAVPGSVTRLVARCLEKDPAARPQSGRSCSPLSRAVPRDLTSWFVTVDRCRGPRSPLPRSPPSCWSRPRDTSCLASARRQRHRCLTT